MKVSLIVALVCLAVLSTYTIVRVISGSKAVADIKITNEVHLKDADKTLIIDQMNDLKTLYRSNANKFKIISYTKSNGTKFSKELGDFLVIRGYQRLGSSIVDSIVDTSEQIKQYRIYLDTAEKTFIFQVGIF